MTWKTKAQAVLDPIAILLSAEPIDWRAVEEAAKTLPPLLETHPGVEHYVHPTSTHPTPAPDQHSLDAIDQIELLQPALLKRDLAMARTHINKVRELLAASVS